MNKEQYVLLGLKMYDGLYRRGGRPYIVHPLSVAESLKPCTDEVYGAAILHDVIEDTDQDAERLIALGVPEEVVSLVLLLTKDEGVHYNDYIERIARDDYACAIKAADIRDNMSDNPTPKQVIKYEAAKDIMLKIMEEMDNA